MSDTAGYTFIILLAISVLTWLILTLWLSRRRPRLVGASDAGEFNQWFYTAKWNKKLNFGAFFVTPLWLFANGLWFLDIVYVFAAYAFPPIAVAISVFLLIGGTSLAWGGGKRWANDVESFLDEQYFWSFLSLIILASLVIIGLIGLL